MALNIQAWQVRRFSSIFFRKFQIRFLIHKDFDFIYDLRGIKSSALPMRRSHKKKKRKKKLFNENNITYRIFWIAWNSVACIEIVKFFVIDLVDHFVGIHFIVQYFWNIHCGFKSINVYYCRWNLFFRLSSTRWPTIIYFKFTKYPIENDLGFFFSSLKWENEQICWRQHKI